MTTVAYRVKSAKQEQLLAHLKMCDDNFFPPLSSRVDLLKYSSKLFDNSVSFEAWDKDVLVGLLNAYFNNIDKQIGFITNVSVLKPYLRQGIAAELLKMCLQHAIDNNMNRLRLGVARDNRPATRLYELFGFYAIQASGEVLLMERVISRDLAK